MDAYQYGQKSSLIRSINGAYHAQGRKKEYFASKVAIQSKSYTETDCEYLVTTEEYR